MIPLSFVFVIMAAVGVLFTLIVTQVFDKKEAFYYKKLGIYIFEVFFLLATLQMYIDYTSVQNVIVILILFAIALFMIQFILDLYGIVVFVANWLQARR